MRQVNPPLVTRAITHGGSSADAGPALARGLGCALLWAMTLRAMAQTVGLWAAGSLGLFSSLTVALLVPVWLFVLFPSWFAWRVPACLRARWLALVACWLSPLVRMRDLASIGVFLDAAADRPFAPAALRPADAWTALAAALQAERRGDPARAERIVEALVHLPVGAHFPWLARVHGIEALVLAAIERGDWAAATRYARPGRGRAIALLALLARGHLGEPVDPRTLWLRFVLAPHRRRTLPFVRALLVRQVLPRAVTPAPTMLATPLERAAVDPRSWHLRLLGAAAQGQPLEMAEVFALAEAWRGLLDGAALARLQARALELEVRATAGQVRAIRSDVLDELALLATAARGRLPEPAPLTLAAEVVGRARERLAEQVETALAPLEPHALARSHPLDAWERWLSLSAVLDRVEHQAGCAVLTTLWHAGVRNTVWNATCALFDRDQPRAAWVSHAMFTWVADRADYLGDVPTALVNRENARVALRATGVQPDRACP